MKNGRYLNLILATNHLWFIIFFACRFICLTDFLSFTNFFNSCFYKIFENQMLLDVTRYSLDEKSLDNSRKLLYFFAKLLVKIY